MAAGIKTTHPDAKHAHLPASIISIIKTPADQIQPAQLDTLKKHFRTIDPATYAITQAIASLKEERDRIKKVRPQRPRHHLGKTPPHPHPCHAVIGRINPGPSWRPLLLPFSPVAKK